MSESAKVARAAMKKKIERLTADPHQKFDASDWTPPEALNTEAKTGLRPVSRRAYKSGGKVKGEAAAKNAGRKARKSGGKAFANSMVTRNVKDANAEEFGKPHTGGYKRGGHADEKQDRKLVKTMVKKSARTGKDVGGLIKDVAGVLPAVAAAKYLFFNKKKGGNPAAPAAPGGPAAASAPADDMGKKRGGAASGNYTGGTRPTGGRLARKHGGKAGKGKTNINIIIGAGHKEPNAPLTPPNQMMPVRPPPSPIPVAPPSAAQPMPMPGAGAGLPPPPMQRKSGGRVGNRRYSSFKDMDAGAGGGLGRLEKTEIQQKR